MINVSVEIQICLNSDKNVCLCTAEEIYQGMQHVGGIPVQNKTE